ncbi:TatD family hydrolase [Microbulbifer thermotolerans]|uniref:Hydrolase TatD n=1 Tax=Microbulbifer thermotolerans TaxID=252514 RepID=A0A143HMJ8_MICTH|nr:TatD family hydrolase [Microbulbifer thermotolerans]AMX02502.1 hydrolase TatD [Microbulbifer thermotolerans]MCX2779357.1 TatD family hydrolase [Microbulbifer thermotolerans]MCX2782439.1 TatD family hydrolase [Microbulbifer thermotolerans]MCX2795024.1 TatD family hydrolase [Microbulbifer thermotolerans]MCX2800592.1 TatD family hydrolase [Microbulbifer thermotolerans]
MLVDSHCHLDRLKLDNFNGDLDVVLDLARDRGVGKFLCVGISLDNADRVVDLASRYEDVVCSVGVHPLDVDSGLADVGMLMALAQRPKVVALGETGLDYYYSSETKQVQQQSFIAHLEAAGRSGLPVIVHTRNARKDTIDLLREHANRECAGVLHCFTESWDMARAALDLNFYISLSGIVTFKNAEELRDVARKLPLDRLLVETDSPYLAPVPYRGKPNIPAYVREVAEFIAELRGIAFEQLAEITTENFYRLFPRAA